MFEFRDKLSEAYILFLTFNLTAATSSEHVQVFEVIAISLSERKTRSESGEALLAFLQRQRQPQQTRREVKSPLSKELAPSSTTWGNMTLDSIVEDSPSCNIQQGLHTP